MHTASACLLCCFSSQSFISQLLQVLSTGAFRLADTCLATHLSDPRNLLKCDALTCEGVVETVLTSPRRNKELRPAREFSPSMLLYGAQSLFSTSFPRCQALLRFVTSLLASPIILWSARLTDVQLSQMCTFKSRFGARLLLLEILGEKVLLEARIVRRPEWPCLASQPPAQKSQEDTGRMAGWMWWRDLHDLWRLRHQLRSLRCTGHILKLGELCHGDGHRPPQSSWC